ncbi:MAG TPA: hypothetical protein VGL03_14090 [Thermoanaerobaculia bacterium]|jgi:hypothetical protein
MSKETRAVVLGLAVVVLAAVALSFWRRPAAEFRRIRGFRVEVKKTEGGETRKLSVHVPTSLLANLTRLAHIESFGDEIRTQWDKGDVTPKQILEAADESQPGKPGVIKKDDATIEVLADGSAILIDVKDDWDKSVHIRVPRSLVEAISEDHPISTREILRRLDELGPGDVVVIKNRDNEVTITAEPRRRGLHIS